MIRHRLDKSTILIYIRKLEICFTSAKNAFRLLYCLLFARIDLGQDCFCHDCHQSHCDDMGGVGSFDKECRALYVGD